MSIDNEQVIKKLKEQVELQKKKYSKEFEQITKDCEKLKEICEGIKESWTGSCIGYHAKMYYGNFEKPPRNESFSIEWGGINGFSDKWKQHTPIEVKQQIDVKMGNSFSMDKLEKRVKEIGSEIDYFQKGVEIQVASLVGSSVDNPYSLAEKYEPNKKLKAYIGSYVKRQWMSRDSEAFSQGITTPAIIYYEGVEFEAENIIDLSHKLFKTIGLFCDWYESNNKSAKGQTSNGVQEDLSLLHSEINSNCQSLFSTGQYAEAVEKGFKVVRDKLRELTGHETGSEAFGKGKLHINGAAAHNVDGDFNEGSKFLMMAIDMFRNEKSHTSKAKIDDVQKAYEYLSLSSLAMHLLDNAELKP